MSKRNYLVLCEERCCGCKGTGKLADGTECKECDGKGYTKYEANLKKALFELLLTDFITGGEDE